MIFILDSNFNILGILNSESPEGIPFFNDKFTIKNDGTMELTFQMPYNAPISDYMQGEGFILYKTQEGKFYLLRIVTIEENSLDDERVREIKAENMAIGDLNRTLIRPHSTYQEMPFTLEEYVEYCLHDSDWVLGSINNVDNAKDVKTMNVNTHTNALAMLRTGFDEWKVFPEFVVSFDGLRITSKVINLYKLKEIEVDRIFTFGVDLKGVKRTVISDQVINALLPLGAVSDGASKQRVDLTYGDAEGFNYIIKDKYKDDIFRLPPPNDDLLGSKSAMARYGMGRLLVGMLETENKGDWQRLMDDGCEELAKKCKPQMQYEMQIQTMKELSMLEEEKPVQLGYTCIIIDESFNPPIRVEATCTEKSTSWTVPENNEVVLGEFREISTDTRIVLNKLKTEIDLNKQDWVEVSKKVRSGVAISNDPNIDPNEYIQLNTLSITSPDGEKKIIYISNEDTDPQVNMIKMSADTIKAEGANGVVLATAIENIEGYNPATGEIEITSGIQMAQVLSQLPKYIYRRLVIRFKNNITGNFILEGFYGGGEIVIAQDDYTLTGTYTFLRNSCRIGLSNGTNGKITGMASGTVVGNYTLNALVNIIGCTEVELFGLKIYGGSGSTFSPQGIFVVQSNVIISSAQIFNVNTCIQTRAAQVYIGNCTGKARNGFGVNATQLSIIGGTGTVPQGSGGTSLSDAINLATGSYNTTTFSSASAGTNDGTTGTTVTKRFYNSSSRSWNTLYAWRTDIDVVQGRWATYGHHRGFWFFGTDLSSALSGKNITSMKVYITRKSGAGYNQPIPVRIYTHDMAAYTDNPNSTAQDPISNGHIYTGAYVTTNLTFGESKWVDITSLANRFSSHGAKGLCVYTPSTSETEYGKFNTDIIVEVTYTESSYETYRYIRNQVHGNTVNNSNIFNEIQAFVGGTNVALGKTVTAERLSGGTWVNIPTPVYTLPEGSTNFSYVVDGNINTWLIPDWDFDVPMRVTVDLGSLQPIEYIKLWHYYVDGRTFHDNIVEVSKDGVNWITVFDSNIDGEYAESVEGKTIYL